MHHMNCFNFKIEFFVQNWSTSDENFQSFCVELLVGGWRISFQLWNENVHFFERGNFKLCLRLKTMLIQLCFWFSNFCYLFLIMMISFMVGMCWRRLDWPSIQRSPNWQHTKRLVGVTNSSTHCIYSLLTIQLFICFILNNRCTT